MAGERPAARESALMRRALANAEHGWGQTAPNPMVGAVIVSGEDVIADGWHARFGEAHAESMALEKAGERARGSTMYVTLEPCVHQGKTGPCVPALIAAGVKRVVVASTDPNPIAGGGIDRLRAAGIEVDVGVETAAARELNAAYLNSFASDRPWITLKLAVSADGGIADPAGQRRWITGAESRRVVHRMRAGVDAVAVGIGTVLADDPQLTVRDVAPPRRPPARVIFDSNVRTPPGASVVRTARDVPTIVVARPGVSSRADALRSSGVEILEANGLPDALTALRARGLQSVLVEGGARLAGSFLQDRLADRVTIFQAPVTLGPEALRGFKHAPDETEQWLKTLPVIAWRRMGEDPLITYAVREVAVPGSA